MSSVAKVLAFVLITSLMSGFVALVMGRIKVQETVAYSAIFTDVSGLSSETDVRVAGVSVGSVEDITLREDATVEVRIALPKEVELSDGTLARVRYANLVGDRFIDLTEGEGGTLLAPGATIPVNRTQPALDLDTLFEGFQPLLQALSPDDVNQLTANILAVTDGQGPAIESLLVHVSGITSTLADRDKLIGSVIDNLNTVLGTVNSRRDDFNRIITGLGDLVGGLAEDRKSIGRSLVKVNGLAADTTSLLESLRPGLRSTLSQTDRLTSAVLLDATRITETLDLVPQALALLARAGSYGSFFNFYLCSLNVRFSDEGAAVPIETPVIASTEKRCQS